MEVSIVLVALSSRSYATTQLIGHVLTYIVHLVIIYQFLTWTVVLKSRFRMLHYLLDKVAKNCTSNFSGTFDVQMIHVVTELYHKLIDMSLRLNLFVRLTQCFISILGSAYGTVFIAIFAGSNHYQIGLIELLYVIASSVEALIVVHYTSRFCDRVTI